MSTDQRTLPGTFALDSDFRSWGSGIAAQIAAVGLVKAADTGQIDWTTVLKPSGATQQRGYEIWRFNDALQATKPVFIRIDFGSSSTALLPGLWVNVGTGTNGAGTLTGQVGTTRQLSSSGGGTTSYCSGSSSRLSLSTNSVILNICVERTKTSAGADTGDGIVRYAYSQNAALGYQLVPFTGVVPAEALANPAIDSNAGGVSVVGTDVMLSPTVAFYGKPLFASWCIYKDAQITALTPITFTHLGATRTYMPLGANSATAYNSILTSTAYALAILWE